MQVSICVIKCNMFIIALTDEACRKKRLRDNSNLKMLENWYDKNIWILRKPNTNKKLYFDEHNIEINNKKILSIKYV